MPFASVNGRELFTVSVPGTGETADNERVGFLFIHGLGSAHSFYFPAISELTASGYDSVAYDTYGSGQSKYRGGEQSVKSMALDVQELIKARKLEASRTILVGHSMGGMVACEVATQLNLRGLVLLGPVHPTPAMGDIFQQRISNVITNGMEALADTVPASATGSKATAVHRSFVRALIMAQEPQGYASLCKVIADADAPDYSAVACPLLILAGAEDKTSPLSSSEMILDRTGTAREQKKLDILDGVGHWHGVEAGEEVGRRLVEFAKSL